MRGDPHRAQRALPRQDRVGVEHCRGGSGTKSSGCAAETLAGAGLGFGCGGGDGGDGAAGGDGEEIILGGVALEQQIGRAHV